MSLRHGDWVTIQVQPLKIAGFASFLRSWNSSVPYQHFQTEHSPNDKDSLQVRLGDVSKTGQILTVGEPFFLTTRDGLSPVSWGGNVILTHRWDQQPSPPVVVSANGVPNGSAIQNKNAYWLSFYGHHFQKWGIPSSGPFWNIINRLKNKKEAFFYFFKESHHTPTPQSPQSQSNVFPKNVYLTIDDCSSPYTVSIVDRINRDKIPSLWFVNGKHCEQYPEGLDAICRSEWCTVGIHTYDHRNMTQMSFEEVRTQIARTIKLVEDAHFRVGKKWDGPRYFRFPYTDRGQDAVKRAQLQGILQEFNFVRHPGIHKAIHDDKNIDIAGPFIEDGLYKNKSRNEFEEHVKERMEFFNKEFPIFFEPLVLGSHDTVHSVTLIELLQRNNVKFLPI